MKSNPNISHQTSTERYRYGWNGAEKDDEIRGTTGASYDLGARMYDPRIGRMLSVDPWTDKYPWQSPYVYHKNSPIASIDWKGFGGPGDRELNQNINGGAGDKSAAGSSGTGADGRSSVFADVSMTNGNTNNPSKAFPSLIAKEAGISLAQLYKYNPGLEENRHEIGQGQQIFTSGPAKANTEAQSCGAVEENCFVGNQKTTGGALVAGGGFFIGGSSVTVTMEGENASGFWETATSSRKNLTYPLELGGGGGKGTIVINQEYLNSNPTNSLTDFLNSATTTKSKAGGVIYGGGYIELLRTQLSYKKASLIR